MRFQAARYDLVCKLITNWLIVICLVLLGANTWMGRTGGSAPIYAPLFVLVPLLLAAWAFHPQCYWVTGRELRIKRPFGSICIPLEAITNIRGLEQEELGIIFKVFAVGGVFGYYGKYTSASLGAFDMWSTNTEELVLIEYGQKKLVISPAERDKLIAEVLLAQHS